MELVNKIDEKELFAARSTADAAGNNIADTYAKKTEIPDISDLVTQQELSSELNTKQDNLSTEQLYNIDNAVTSLAGVMAENKLTIEDGKITEYDGTPFAGGGSGGKTYTGVEPIIVDNDNDTISADTVEVNYQQIVHDDSLVHVSNNAQYALGVNVPKFSAWTDVTNEFTFNTTYFVGKPQVLYNEYLNLITFSNAFIVKSFPTSWTNVASMPLKYSPLTGLEYYTRGSAVSGTLIQINFMFLTNGTIQAQASSTSQTYMSVSFMYPCQGGN